jgi:anti-anti-sigma factor
MSVVTVEPVPAPHLTLSTRLVYELGEPRSGLRATTDRRGSALVIYAGGEVDACNEKTWHRLVNEAAMVSTAPGPFVVDVTGLDFMACCAFAALAEAAERCQSRGVELRVVSAQPIIARIIHASGLGAALPVYATVDEAVAAPRLQSN